MLSLRLAILLDGAFVIRKIENRLRRFPTALDIVHLCNGISEFPEIRGHSLLRNYFYHAPPADKVLVNPISKASVDLSLSGTHAKQKKLLDTLEQHRDFALRLGDLAAHDWRLGNKAMRSLMEVPRILEAQDLVPNISQKGVDLRIGLDIARLSLRHLVDVIVVVTGDSDLVPAFRFARREGLRIYLDHLGHGVTRRLTAHCDVVLPNSLLGLGNMPEYPRVSVQRRPD